MCIWLVLITQMKHPFPQNAGKFFDKLKNYCLPKTSGTVNISYVRARSQIYKYWSIHYGAFYVVGVLKGEGDVFLRGQPLSGLAAKPFCQCSSYI